MDKEFPEKKYFAPINIKSSSACSSSVRHLSASVNPTLKEFPDKLNPICCWQFVMLLDTEITDNNHDLIICLCPGGLVDISILTETFNDFAQNHNVWYADFWMHLVIYRLSPVVLMIWPPEVIHLPKEYPNPNSTFLPLPLPFNLSQLQGRQTSRQELNLLVGTQHIL